MKKSLQLLLLLAGTCFSAAAQHYTSVRSGSEFVIALRSDSTLWGWGSNKTAQLGTITADMIIDTAMPVVPAQKWIAVAPGSFHTLAIAADSSLWGWGFNLTGNLGIGTTDTISAPVQINNTAHWKAASCGMEHTLALRSDGTIWSTGYNYYGQLGLGDTLVHTTFTRVGTDNDWKAIAAGGVHSMAIKNNGTLWAWGFNYTGELGLGNTTNVNTPTQVGTDNDWVAVSSGFEYTIALKADGTVWSWGFNGNGQLGRSIAGIEDSTPQMVPGLANIRTISAGADFNFVIKQDGTLWAWGFNLLGQLGISSSTQLDTPAQVGTDTDWADITAAAGYISNNAVYGVSSAGLKNNATSVCTAGANYAGQLCNGNISGSTAAQAYFDCSAAPVNQAGVTNVINEQELSLYPNPATDNLYLTIPQAMKDKTLSLTITGISGKTFITKTLSGADNNINVTSLSPGIYFLQIADNKGIINHIRFVKE